MLYEDQLWHLTHQVSPVQLAGFLVLQPLRHVEHISELAPEEATTLGPVLSLACDVLMDVLGSEKVYVSSFGSAVRHVHFWLVPRSREMLPAVTGPDLLREVFTGRWACSDAEAAAVAQKVRLQITSRLFLQ